MIISQGSTRQRGIVSIVVQRVCTPGEACTNMVGKIARGGALAWRGVEIDAEFRQRRQARLAAAFALEDLEALGHRGAQQRRHGEPGLERSEERRVGKE